MPPANPQAGRDGLPQFPGYATLKALSRQGLGPLYLARRLTDESQVEIRTIVPSHPPTPTQLGGRMRSPPRFITSADFFVPEIDIEHSSRGNVQLNMADESTSSLTDLLDKVFDGSAAKLVMQALAATKTSPEELAEIRKLLKKRGENR